MLMTAHSISDGGDERIAATTVGKDSSAIESVGSIRMRPTTCIFHSSRFCSDFFHSIFEFAEDQEKTEQNGRERNIQVER
jgi:hypothetical protein